MIQFYQAYENIKCWEARGQPLTTYAKFFEKLTFLSPWYAHVHMYIRVLEIYVFWKIFACVDMDEPKNDQRCDKMRIFSSVTISDMKVFAVPMPKKKPEKVIAHVGTNNAPHLTPNEMSKTWKTSSFDTKNDTNSKNNYFVISFTCKQSRVWH